MGDKAPISELGCQCRLFAAEGLGSVRALSDSVVLFLMLLGLLQCLLMLVSGPHGSPHTVNKLSVSSHELFTLLSQSMSWFTDVLCTGRYQERLLTCTLPRPGVGLFLSRMRNTLQKLCHIEILVLSSILSISITCTSFSTVNLLILRRRST